MIMRIEFEIEDNAQSDPPPDFLPGQGGNESVRFTENISSTHFTQDKIQGNQTKPFVFEDFDPITPSFHNLTYACILVPRMPEHHLIGELETFLKSLGPTIRCGIRMAFGAPDGPSRISSLGSCTFP